MALTPAQIDAAIAANGSYTSAQHLWMWQRASIELAASPKSYSLNGRQLTRNDAEEIRAMIDYWQQQVTAEAAGESGNGNVLVRFGEAT